MIISEVFDDIYFSKEDGLAETEYVFLQGCELSDAWADKKRFCIAELGFGTGLNMLAAWRLFEQTAPQGARLDLISIEKYPLNKTQIAGALAKWRGQIGQYLDVMLDKYPLNVPGFHRIDLSDRVSLTLVFDDVLAALCEMDARVDAWFLDGFAPAKNPDMWGADVFGQIARLSGHGARVATFTAAGIVRRHLAEAGFSVFKQKGFGRKRDMITARFNGPVNGQNASEISPVVGRVAVIGAGLAGASAAWHLARAGVGVKVFEAGKTIAGGASGNDVGLINPKLSVQRCGQTDYYVGAYDYALRLLGGLGGVEFRPHGSLHLQLDDDKARKFDGYVRNLGWDGAHMQMLDARAASDIAGVRVDAPCLYYPDAAAVSPRLVCQKLLEGIEVEYGTRYEPGQAFDGFDSVIYAGGVGTQDFGIKGLELQAVRGQVCRIGATPLSQDLRSNLCYGGYLAPAFVGETGVGVHMCGATFQPWGTQNEILPEDNARIMAQLKSAVPVFEAEAFEVKGAWVGFRAASRDRFAVVGAVDGGWVSTAHGSHGIISGLMGGAVMAAKITGAPLPISRKSFAALGVDRFKRPV